MTPNDEKIVELMREHGLEVTWEHPGAAAIKLEDPADVTEVWTGLNGWEYGTVTVDGEPVDVAAEPDGLYEDVTDPELIARCWADWVRAAQSVFETLAGGAGD